MKLKKASIFYGAITIAMIIAFLSTYLCGTAMCIIPHYFNISLAVIPILIFVILFIYSLKNSINKPLMISSFVMTILFFVLTVLNCFWIAIDECTTEIRDITYYTRVLEFYDYPEDEMEVFLKEIPENAKETEFYECPVPFNGKSRVLLRLKYDEDIFEEEVNLLTEKYSNPITAITQTSNPNTDTKDSIVKVADNEYYLSNDIIEYFNLKSNLTEWAHFICTNEKNSEDWTHGKTSGAAVNYDTFEIIYYAFEW